MAFIHHEFQSDITNLVYHPVHKESKDTLYGNVQSLFELSFLFKQQALYLPFISPLLFS